MNKVDHLNRIIVAFYCINLIFYYYEVMCNQCNLQTQTRLISHQLDKCWYTYKARYKKVYLKHEEAFRRIIWEDNFKRIHRHNTLAVRGCLGYTLRDNYLADRSTVEYLREMTRLIESKRCPAVDDHFVGAVPNNTSTLAESLDWREKGFEIGAEHQLNCASCYAHSIARSIQGHLFKKLNQMINLSVQQLVDCSTESGNLGCVGGSLRNTLRYLQESRGLMDEYHYPYSGKQGKCRFQHNNAVVNISSWAIIPANDERMMQDIVAQLGPIAASLNASPKTFQLYNSGVYNDPQCTSSVVNHAVLIVGYTPTYWIVKNWWGSDWGENGYMRIAKMKNMCGIANFAAYARL